MFREKITGTTADRPQLAALMKKLAHGDVVITPAVNRLSPDTTDLLVIARDMQRAGAGIRSPAEPFLDTTSDFGEIIFAILRVAAKLERRRILERTAHGRADAMAEGVKFGPRPMLTLHQQKEARTRLERGETQRSVARIYNLNYSMISRLLSWRVATLAITANKVQEILDEFSLHAEEVVKSFAREIEANPAPETIYHYTDDRGPAGILESARIRLTEIFGLNRPHRVATRRQSLHQIAKDGGGPR